MHGTDLLCCALGSMCNPSPIGFVCCRHYRKRLICALPQLIFLDESAVTDKDRRLAAAFVQVGRLSHLVALCAPGRLNFSAGCVSHPTLNPRSLNCSVNPVVVQRY